MVSFKNESIKQRIEKRRKAQSSSLGIVIAFLILVISIGVFGGMKFWQGMLEDEIAVYDKDVAEIKASMNEMVSGSEADFYKRMNLVKEKIYNKHSSITVLNEVEKIMVNRVVLLSFSHSVDGTGLEQVSVTADADEFYLMAQQIAEFKNSEFFGNVRASDTSRDNVGRIVFTITADIVDDEMTLYSENGPGSTTRPSGATTGEIQPQPQPVEAVEENVPAVETTEAGNETETAGEGEAATEAPATTTEEGATAETGTSEQ